ncbi:MAG: lyase [Rhodospirillales bacterium]|nr:lyase [Rhodospirillales bacterium]
MRLSLLVVLAVLTAFPAAGEVRVQSYEVPRGDHPHDVAPAADGRVWYTAQMRGALGLLDPATGKVERVPLGEGSRPHGVIVGPDGTAWVTDGGLNAIVAVDSKTLAVRRYPLPAGSGHANLNTAAFDGDGILWFTGQAGIYGRLDPASGEMRVFKAPRGRGPYGIAATPEGTVWYASLAGNHIARIEGDSGEATVVEPPTRESGPRRVWSDSNGVLWVSQWHAGQVAAYDPRTDKWREWRLPGGDPAAYSVYVDERDMVWVTDFGANAVVRFDPASETFQSFPLPRDGAAVRQMLGRPGEAWAPESATDRLTVFRWE